MKCPKCSGRSLVNSRYEVINGYKRKYRCPNCGHEHSTIEMDEKFAEAIIKFKRGISREINIFNDKLKGR